MKKNKKRITVLLLVLLLLVVTGVGVASMIYKYTNRDFVYEKLEDGTLELSEYRGTSKIVNIPERVWGRKVTRIGIICFRKNYMGKEGGLNGFQVYIPDTVTEIGDGAFRECKSLTITGAKNVEKIGVGAFFGCEFVEPYPFSDKLKWIDYEAFFYAENVGELTFPDTLEFIGRGAFGDSDVEKVQFPKSQFCIEPYAFENTPWLEQQSTPAIIGRNTLIKYPVGKVTVTPEGVDTISSSIKVNNHRDEEIKEFYVSRGVKTIMSPMVRVAYSEIKIYIPATVTDIVENTHSNRKGIVEYGMEDVTLIVEKDSYAEAYAKKMKEEYGSQYEIVDQIEYPE